MANDTPESDFSIECFQNYSAPEVFVQGLAGIVDQTDVEMIIRAQKTMLQRFEKTTEMLTNCNQLSASRFRAASTEFKKHTQLLIEMKKDLEYIFKKIRAIKTRLSTQYPDAYKIAIEVAALNRKPLEGIEDDKTSESKTQTKMVTTVSTETLKPSTSEDIKKPKRREKDRNNEVKKTNSSSSETESASSGDNSSSDTG